MPLGGADVKIVEGRPCMCAISLPTKHHNVAVGDEGADPAEAEVGERRTEPGHEGLHSWTPAAGGVHGVLQANTWCRQFIDDIKNAWITPERSEPSMDDCLIQGLRVHRVGINHDLLRSVSLLTCHPVDANLGAARALRVRQADSGHTPVSAIKSAATRPPPGDVATNFGQGIFHHD
jgi:hypothetical protein